MAKYVLFGPQPDNQPKTTVPRPQKQKEPELSDSFFPCSFRGIQFPVTSMSVSQTHDMAEHKYYGVPTANVEMTGRNSLTFEAEIPFVNGITPGKNERWGKLFPEDFMKFASAMNNTTSGLLDTPQLAGIVVKPVSLEYKHDANIRDGVVVTARWIETYDLDLKDTFKKPTYQSIRLAALNLDAEYVPGDRLVDLPKQPKSFEQLVNELSGIADTVASKFTMITNKPDAILYRVNKVKDSLVRANNAATWPVREAAEAIEDALHSVKSESNNGYTPEVVGIIQNGKIQRVTVPYRMTVSQIALLTQNTVNELLQLNPSLARTPRIAAGTVVRAYTHDRLRP